MCKRFEQTSQRWPGCEVSCGFHTLLKGQNLAQLLSKNFPANPPWLLYTPTDVNGDVNQKDRCKNVQRHFIPKNPELETFQMSINCRADKQIVYLPSGTLGDKEKMNGHIWSTDLNAEWLSLVRVHLYSRSSQERSPSALMIRPDGG